MTRARSEDPLKVFRFTVEDTDFKRAGFREVNGLEATVEVAEYREGGDNDTVKKSAGLVSYGNITLIRGQVLDSAPGGENDMYEWFAQVSAVSVGGNPDNYRRDISITQYDAAGAEARKWSVYEAWPVRFKPFSDLNATTNDNSVEEVELAHEGFELASSA